MTESISLEELVQMTCIEDQPVFDAINGYLFDSTHTKEECLEIIDQYAIDDQVHAFIESLE